MSGQKAILTVRPPVPRKQLGYYRNVAGYFVIRREQKVLYVGKAKDIEKVVFNLFQKHGKLVHLNINLMTIEVIESTLRTTLIKRFLKKHLTPQYNTYDGGNVKLALHQKKRLEEIEAAYCNQSRFDVVGNHRSDKTQQNEG